MAEKENYPQVRISHKKSRLDKAESRDEQMKSAHSFFNDIYLQLSIRVEQEIEGKEKNKLRSKFKKEGKEYEEDIIETIKEYREGVMFTRQVKKGRRETADFREAWKNSYLNNKKLTHEKYGDYRIVNHYWGRTNHIYKMYKREDE
jgi:hypothetical protein